MSFIFNIKQALPTNVVSLAHVDGDLSSPENAMAVELSEANSRLPKNSFLQRISYGIVLDAAKANAELGFGTSNLKSNDADITNIVSHASLGVPVPLYYKYLIENLNIVMPVDTNRYVYLVASASTPEELEELFVANNLIRDSLIDRIYFTDIYNESSSVKFNIKIEHLNDNFFDVTIYVPDSSKNIGTKYVVYRKSNSLFKQILRSIPIYKKLAWVTGNVLYRGVN